tara:strand:- start:6419 stop:7393 length:975 start_codon:yes stop_codon:yes gene_type:complete
MGLSTKVFNTETFPVPNEWIFEKFLNLQERLTGQSVSIKSIFNAADSNPSMIIYLHVNGKYKFKDFSSGEAGDAVDLIQSLYNLTTRQDAFRKAYDFWQEGEYKDYSSLELLKTTYDVIDVKIRKWNTNDVKYWSQYNIGSKELEHYNIKPLAAYVFQMTKGENVSNKEFSKAYCYGFFRKDGTLYKIYNSKDKKRKFIKVKNYIQGHDQLKYKASRLILLASLKDLISFRKLGFPDIECVAPDSENTIITPKQVSFYKKRFKHISILFDNDSAGKKASLKYKEQYGIEIISFDIEKDLADCVKEHGLINTKIFMEPHIKNLKK